MASPIEPFMPYLNTFIFFAAYTVLYKNNPVYRIAQSLVVGVGAGYLLVANINAFNRGVVTQTFVDGSLNWAMLIPWILGIGYCTIFVPKLISVYRAVSILTLTVGMGVVLPYGPALFWTITTGYAQNALNILSEGFTVASFGQLLTAVAYALGLSYFFFTDAVSKPTTTFRNLGRIVLLIYTAMTITTTALGKINLVQWKVLDTLNGVPSTWWIPALMFVVMAIDHVYPLKNLLGGGSKAES
jgi:hypothetical protein